MLISEIEKNIPTGCICEVEELPNQVKSSSVKSYGLTIECDGCKIKREEQNIISEKQRKKQDILTKLNQLDLQAIRPLMENENVRIKELVSQKQKLRTEFSSL